MLDRNWIAAHIPHQGSMCLLDRVESWDREKILCHATSHCAPDNPLRNHGQLGIACGIEYAAQAMAVHGALLASADDSPPRAGYLVSVRGVNMLVSRLDDIAGDLMIEAACIMTGENNMLYQFSVHADDKLLLSGRAAVVIDAGLLTNSRSDV